MHRFFSHHPLLPELRLTPGDQFHQISHVFRAKKGECLVFFEEGGKDRIYEIVQISKKEIILNHKETIQGNIHHQQQKIKILQAYPNKIQTMELIIQKIVELGINEIVFFSAQHSQMRAIPEHKRVRLSSIAVEALEQSGGNIPLQISYSGEGAELLLQQQKDYHNVVGFIGGDRTIDISAGNNPLGFWVGPEGGWSEQEKDFFVKNNAKLWSFSSNILRLETASIIGAGILKYLSEIEK